MKTTVLSVFSTALILFAVDTNAQLNVGATASATLKTVTSVNGAGALNYTQSQLKSALDKSIKTTKEVKSKSAAILETKIDQTKEHAGSLDKNVTTAASINSSSENEIKTGGNADAAIKFDAATNSSANAEIKSGLVSKTQEKLDDTKAQTMEKTSAAKNKSKAIAKSGINSSKEKLENTKVNVHSDTEMKSETKISKQ